MSCELGEQIAHTTLSKLISANAIVPPWIENSVNMFSIVRIKPRAPASDMIEPLHANLCHVLSDSEKEQLRHVHGPEPSAEPKRLSLSTELSQRATINVRAFFESLGFRSGSDVGHMEDIEITDFATEFLKENHFKTVEKLVFRHFQELIARTSVQSAVRERFLIGVITGIATGKLVIKTKEGRQIELGANAGTETVAADAHIEGKSQRMRNVESGGIVGLNMVCFLVKTNAEEMKYKISKAIWMIRGDEDRSQSARKYLYSGRGLRKVLALFKKKEHLFAAGHIVDGMDESLTEEERQSYNNVTSEMGLMPSVLGVVEEMPSEGERVQKNFMGVMGRDMWNLDGHSMGKEENRLNQFLIATDMNGLADAMDDEDLPWMLEVDMEDSQ